MEIDSQPNHTGQDNIKLTHETTTRRDATSHKTIARRLQGKLNATSHLRRTFSSMLILLAFATLLEALTIPERKEKILSFKRNTLLKKRSSFKGGGDE